MTRVISSAEWPAFVVFKEALRHDARRLVAEYLTLVASAGGSFLIVAGDGDYYALAELTDGTVISGPPNTEEEVAVALGRPAMEHVRVALERGQRTAAGSAPSPAVSPSELAHGTNARVADGSRL